MPYLLLILSLCLPLLTLGQTARPVSEPYTLHPVGSLSGDLPQLTTSPEALAPLLQQRLAAVDRQAPTPPQILSLHLQRRTEGGYFLLAHLHWAGQAHQARFSLLSLNGHLHLPETGHIELCAGQLHPDGPGCDGDPDGTYQVFFDVP